MQLNELIKEAGQMFSLVDYITIQQQWSYETFGPGSRTKGVVEHIRKELEEIERQPYDLLEWIDVAILALDGAWRSGASPEQIVMALQEKQLRNLRREWPDWRKFSEDQPIEHVRKEETRPSSTPPASNDYLMQRVCYECGHISRTFIDTPHRSKNYCPVCLNNRRRVLMAQNIRVASKDDHAKWNPDYLSTERKGNEDNRSGNTLGRADDRGDMATEVGGSVLRPASEIVNDGL